jgi:hypothetical protein
MEVDEEDGTSAGRGEGGADAGVVVVDEKEGGGVVVVEGGYR